MSAAHFSLFTNRNLTVERILSKAAGHLRLKYSTQGTGRGERRRIRTIDLSLFSYEKLVLLIFVHNIKMVSIGTDRFLYLISDADVLDILWIFWFSCMKGKEMRAR